MAFDLNKDGDFDLKWSDSDDVGTGGKVLDRGGGHNELRKEGTICGDALNDGEAVASASGARGDVRWL